jgi:MarR family transcriptional regulator, transcriptional regulator for hemolysin
MTLSVNDDAHTTQTDLARALELGKTTLVGLLDRLELKGFVTRTSDPTDRRIKYVTLTRVGLGVVSKIEHLVESANAVILGDISAADRSHGEAFLSLVKGHLIDL